MSGTSNISLRYFQEIARQSGEGVVRFSMDRHGEERLINKGTLASKIATVLDIGQASTHGERNKRALAGFRESLIAGYGDHGRLALQELGLDEGNVQALTGSAVLTAIDRAEQLRRQVVETQRGRHGDTDVYEDVVQELRIVLVEKRPNEVDIKLDAFRDRVSERCRFESDLYSLELSDDEIRQFAQEEKSNALARLERDHDLWISGLRRDLRTASDRLLDGIEGKDRLQAVLRTIGDRLRILTGNGDIPAVGQDRIRQYAKAMFAERISRQVTDGEGNIDTRRGDEIGRVHHAMLQQDSTLRQVYFEVGPEHIRRAVVEGMIEAMARVLGPVANTPGGDIERLKQPLPPPPDYDIEPLEQTQDPSTGSVKYVQSETSNLRETLGLDDDDLYSLDDKSVDSTSSEQSSTAPGVVPGAWIEPQALYTELEGDPGLQDLGIGMVLSDGATRDEFWLRFDQRCWRESNLGASTLDSEDVRRIAVDEMERFLTRLKANDLNEVRGQRQRVEEAGMGFFLAALNPNIERAQLEEALREFVRVQPQTSVNSQPGVARIAAAQFMSRTIEQTTLVPREELIRRQREMLKEGSTLRQLFEDVLEREQLGNAQARAMRHTTLICCAACAPAWASASARVAGVIWP